MRLIRQLSRWLRINFIIAKYGVRTLIVFFKFQGRNRFKKHPAILCRKTQITLKDLKPILSTIAKALIKSDKISTHDKTRKWSLLKNIMMRFSKKATIEQELCQLTVEIQSPPPCAKASVQTEQIEQQLKKIWENLNISQISEEKIVAHIDSFINQGKKIKKQFSQSIQHNITEYLQQKLPSRTELDAFCHDVNDLSLRTSQLQTQVNKLMSPHEII